MKEIWWWKEEVQTRRNANKPAFKEWQDTGDENKNMAYTTAKRERERQI